jgi:hypothetical protein
MGIGMIIPILLLTAFIAIGLNLNPDLTLDLFPDLIPDLKKDPIANLLIDINADMIQKLTLRLGKAIADPIFDLRYSHVISNPI